MMRSPTIGYGGGLDRKARLLAHERGEPVFANPPAA